MLSFLKPKPAPDQPVEFWLVVYENTDLGVLGTKVEMAWFGRTVLISSTAGELDLLKKRMPKGCSKDNPWVFAKLGLANNAPINEYTKEEFLHLFVDVPLMPTKTFFESLGSHLDSSKAHLQKMSDILSKF